AMADSMSDAATKPAMLKQSLVRINLTASETTVLHLIITSCPAAVDELAGDDSRETVANYGYTSDDNLSNETTSSNGVASEDFSEVLRSGATNQSESSSKADSAIDGGLDSSKAEKSHAKQKGAKQK